VSDERRLAGASAAGLLPDEAACRALLDATVATARRAFGAAACSITLLDEQAGELVFAAVAGEGAETIVGERFSADIGIAGWALTSQQPLAIDEVRVDPRFAAGVAESTGYVPTAIMAAPLLRGERGLGVLSVLDRDKDALAELAAMDLLDAFAAQASIAAELVERTRRARALAGGEEAELAVVARLTAALDRLEGRRHREGIALLEALERVLARP
jgi:signal transduction protein with GAF and PtsI domain